MLVFNVKIMFALTNWVYVFKVEFWSPEMVCNLVVVMTTDLSTELLMDTKVLCTW